MAQDISEQCRERLREIERRLSSSVAGARSLPQADVRSGLVATVAEMRRISQQADIDERCKDILRTLEPKAAGLYKSDKATIARELEPFSDHQVLAMLERSIYVLRNEIGESESSAALA